MAGNLITLHHKQLAGTTLQGKIHTQKKQIHDPVSYLTYNCQGLKLVLASLQLLQNCTEPHIVLRVPQISSTLSKHSMCCLIIH